MLGLLKELFALDGSMISRYASCGCRFDGLPQRRYPLRVCFSLCESAGIWTYLLFEIPLSAHSSGNLGAR